MKLRTRTISFAILPLVLLLPLMVLGDKVDDYVRAQMTERHVPGVAVAVLRNGRLVKMQGYGLASLEFNAPVTTETVFEIGSVSKQMTAAAIMLLVEDGKVDPDQPVSKYLPGTPDAWAKVTVRHLLTHTSGIKSYSSLDGFELSRRLKVADFIKLLAPHPLEFTPGERNIYSNSGFNLLAFIIESRSGMPYLEFMRKRIFGPLGMTKTGDRDPQFIIKNRATGYEWENGHLSGRDGSLTDLTGAGSIVSTIGDMVRWDNALRATSFLKPASRSEVWKQFVFNNGQASPYGFGWRISSIRGHKLIGHTGQTAGFGSANFRYVDQDTAVIVLTNIGSSGVGGLIAAGVAKLYIPTMSVRAMKGAGDADAELTGRVLAALRSRLENKPDTKLLSTQLVQALSTERSRLANDRIAAFGTVRSLVLVGEENTNGTEFYLYRADTGRRLFLWRVALDENGSISEMTLDEEE